MREKITTAKGLSPKAAVVYNNIIYMFIYYIIIFVGIVYTDIKRHTSTTRTPTTCVLVVRLCKDISTRDDSDRVEGYNNII